MMSTLDLTLFESYAIEVYIDPVWVNLTPDVLINPAPKWNVGIMSNGQLDRVGDPELFSFSLRNDSTNSVNLIGYYSPGHTNVRSGWTTGLDVRLSFVFGGETFEKYYGTIDIDGIVVSPGELEARSVKVSCHGFMSKAASHNLNLMSLQANIRIEEAVAYILANMPVQPTAVSYEVGQSTFPYAFDTVTKDTKAIGEFTKLAVSELSYIYTRSDGTLVVEGRNTRTDFTDDSAYPIPATLSGKLQQEDSFYLLQENGDYLLLDEAAYFDFTGMALRPGAITSFGSDLVNFVSAITYPRRIDAAATTTLFTLQKSLKVEAGQTLTGVRGEYRDPSGGASYVNGSSMVTPTTPTHYQMFANEDGTGSDLSANLVVTPVYGTDAVEYTLQNTGGSDGWVTKLNAVGKGRYIYDPVTIIAEDAVSQAIHGVHELKIDMPYQSTPSVGTAYANYVLSRDKNPKTKVDKFPMFANYDASMLAMFCWAEPGTRGTFTDSMSGINGSYFIQGYEATLVAGSYVFWTPILKIANINSGWVLGTSALGSTTILGEELFG